ncbi:MAG: flavin reductase family protein [Casimicrobiaceae bacterium]
MDWDIETLTRSEVSKLLHSTVVPRPIALVTTLDTQNRVNAAPFSFFNVMCTAPPLIALGIDGSETSADHLKDTTRNIEARGELVVSLVDETLVSAANVCAIEVSAGIDETAMAKLQLLPSVRVAPPRIASSPVQFECRLKTLIPVTAGRSIIIGEIVHIHVRDDLVDEHFHIDVGKLGLVGRMHGNGWYTRTGDRFQVKRIPIEEWPPGSS